jgi:hypothetical protein
MFSDESHFELRFGGQEADCKGPNGSYSLPLQFTMKMLKHLPNVMLVIIYLVGNPK